MKKQLLLFALGIASLSTFAQEVQPVATFAAPFANIAPDARATGMGNIGAATQGDVYSMYWNPSKYSFAPDKFGVALSYANAVENLITLNAYYQISPKAGTIAIGARYFTNPKIGPDGNGVSYKVPNDFLIDLAYSYRISKKFSVALAGRYFSLGGIKNEQGESVSKSTFAADVAAFYNDSKELCKDNKLNWGVGLNFSNLGSKVQMIEGGSKDFLPANMRLGGRIGADMRKHSLSFGVDFSKLLVPAYDANSTKELTMGDAFKSWNDMIYGFGLEYGYDKMVMGRVGYSYQAENQGGMQFVTVGLGGQFKGVALDLSYWIPTLKNSLLKNTFRVSLAYTF